MTYEHFWPLLMLMLKKLLLSFLGFLLMLLSGSVFLHACFQKLLFTGDFPARAQIGLSLVLLAWFVGGGCLAFECSRPVILYLVPIMMGIGLITFQCALGIGLGVITLPVGILLVHRLLQLKQKNKVLLA